MKFRCEVVYRCKECGEVSNTPIPTLGRQGGRCQACRDKMLSRERLCPRCGTVGVPARHSGPLRYFCANCIDRAKNPCAGHPDRDEETGELRLCADGTAPDNVRCPHRGVASCEGDRCFRCHEYANAVWVACGGASLCNDLRVPKKQRTYGDVVACKHERLVPKLSWKPTRCKDCHDAHLGKQKSTRECTKCHHWYFSEDFPLDRRYAIATPSSMCKHCAPPPDTLDCVHCLEPFPAASIAGRAFTRKICPKCFAEGHRGHDGVRVRNLLVTRTRAETPSPGGRADTDDPLSDPTESEERPAPVRDQGTPSTSAPSDDAGGSCGDVQKCSAVMAGLRKAAERTGLSLRAVVISIRKRRLVQCVRCDEVVGCEKDSEGARSGYCEGCWKDVLAAAPLCKGRPDRHPRTGEVLDDPATGQPGAVSCPDGGKATESDGRCKSCHASAMAVYVDCKGYRPCEDIGVRPQERGFGARISCPSNARVPRVPGKRAQCGDCRELERGKQEGAVKCAQCCFWLLEVAYRPVRTIRGDGRLTRCWFCVPDRMLLHCISCNVDFASQDIANRRDKSSICPTCYDSGRRRQQRGVYNGPRECPCCRRKLKEEDFRDGDRELRVCLICKTKERQYNARIKGLRELGFGGTFTMQDGIVARFCCSCLRAKTPAVFAGMPDREDDDPAVLDSFNMLSTCNMCIRTVMRCQQSEKGKARVALWGKLNAERTRQQEQERKQRKEEDGSLKAKLRHGMAMVRARRAESVDAARALSRASTARRVDQYLSYRDNALSRDELRKLITSPCFFCGWFDPHVRANGVDRIDHDKGHEPGNVLPCCRFCNTFRCCLDVCSYIKRAKHIVEYAKTRHRPHPEAWPPASRGTSFEAYRTGAARRNLPFNYTEAEFEATRSLFPCTFCGAERGPMGLDRVDANLGYEPGGAHTVVACSECNWMRNVSSREDFLHRMESVASSHTLESLARFADLPLHVCRFRRLGVS